MNKVLPLFIALFLATGATLAQTNMLSTNSIAEQILLGNYNPASYKASTVINHPTALSTGINNDVSPDSLKSLLLELNQLGNRNTGSDTLSSSKGIGAARTWVHNRFQQYGQRNEQRLIASYLQFDAGICNINRHKNIFAVLPGMDTSDKSIIIIEGHIDSRCEGVCDTACIALGMEDNATGTALVMELARVMSKYSFNHTIVFLVTIGEEQGLYGAKAFADYCTQKGIPIKAVLNNDVVGGIICGQTASPPGCMGAGTIDSTNVRLFSSGLFNSPHKGLARYMKLEYKEMIQPITPVPMSINILTPEDRTGRGGDHIPFRQNGFTAIRLCAANEHGDANVTSSSYDDRQHTSTDILGLDTDNDLVIDSFFVNFNYLARNAIINGNAAAMLAICPRTPKFNISPPFGSTNIGIYITTEQQYGVYRVGVRTTTHDWDSVYIFTGTYATIPLPSKSNYIVSVASVDGNGVESLFSEEQYASVNVAYHKEQQPIVELLQNHPNPFDGETVISVAANTDIKYQSAYISILDLNGKEVKRLNISLNKGVNEAVYNHGYLTTGMYLYTLVIDGEKIDTKRMIFAN
ncbi:MAG: M28 family peptidase [Flavipsychrobacter sp.]